VQHILTKLTYKARSSQYDAKNSSMTEVSSMCTPTASLAACSACPPNCSRAHHIHCMRQAHVLFAHGLDRCNKSVVRACAAPTLHCRPLPPVTSNMHQHLPRITGAVCAFVQVYWLCCAVL
jgi:hypothetical protein